MKIAYIISDNCGISPFNGIRVQAQTWAEELIRQGHTVDLISPWLPQKWELYDAIHVFGQYEGTKRVVSAIYKYNKNIYFSPIIDTIQPIWKYRIIAHLSLSFFRMETLNSIVRKSDEYIKKWIVRSKYEFEYVHNAYGIEKDKIKIVPLSFRLSIPTNSFHREDFCLHVSKLTDKRKNVLRLLQAAIKYKFKLILVGSISNESDFSEFKKIIDSHESIEYLGRVEDEELIHLYAKAKVFALPSINEGVGMVAVEAAACGCNIVITNIGGPKEYYNGMAAEVNPYSVDDIGKAVVNEMKKPYNKALHDYVIQNFNLNFCVKQLITVYEE